MSEDCVGICVGFPYDTTCLVGIEEPVVLQRPGFLLDPLERLARESLELGEVGRRDAQKCRRGLDLFHCCSLFLFGGRYCPGRIAVPYSPATASIVANISGL